MALTVHTVTLETNFPDQATLDGTWTLSVAATPPLMKDTDGHVVLSGERNFLTDDGVVTLVLPATGQDALDPPDALWRLEFRSSDRTTKLGPYVFELTEDLTLDEIASSTGEPITPTLLTQAEDARDAAIAAAEEAADVVAAAVLNPEAVQDTIAAMLEDTDTVTHTYDDTAGTLSFETPSLTEASLVAVPPLSVSFDPDEDEISLRANTYHPGDRNLIGEPFNPSAAVSVTTLGSGTMIVVRVKATASGSVSKMWTFCGTVGASLTAAYFALYDITGTRLGVTADEKAQFLSTGVKSADLLSPAAVVEGTVYLAAIVVTGTTPPAILRGYSGGAGNIGHTAAPYGQSQLTGQTDAPASFSTGSLTASSIAFYLGIS